MKNLPSSPQKINQQVLVTLTKGKPTTTSLKIAEVFSKKHRNVIRDITSLDCSEDFRRLNYERADYSDEQGKSRPMFSVSKDGLLFLAMGYRGKQAARLKENYIHEFNRMEAALLQRQSAEFLESRSAGKIARRAETDAIKELVDYARYQGSQHPERYYLAFTKLVNQALSINAEGPYPVRDSLPPMMAAKLAVLEGAIAETVQQGIAAGVFYKEVFQLAKGRACALANMLTPTIQRLAA
jgi:Rha family phage regulatory protein